MSAVVPACFPGHGKNGLNNLNMIPSRKEFLLKWVKEMARVC